VTPPLCSLYLSMAALTASPDKDFDHALVVDVVPFVFHCQKVAISQARGSAALC